MKLIRTEVIIPQVLEYRWFINERGDYVKRIINLKNLIKHKERKDWKNV